MYVFYFWNTLVSNLLLFFLSFSVSARSNGTCELATRTIRDSRSVGSNATLSYEDVNKDHAYDVYIESRADGCLPTSPLFQAPSNHLHNQGIPIGKLYIFYHHHPPFFFSFFSHLFLLFFRPSFVSSIYT